MKLLLTAVALASAASAPVPMTPRPDLQAQSYDCQPRKTCGQIGSCEEANWYLNNCSWGGKLDRDGDGAPCESGPC